MVYTRRVFRFVKSRVKPSVLLLGPLPPPFMGPAIATEIILRSRINDDFNIIHLNTNTHQSIRTLGVASFERIGKNVLLYVRMTRKIVRHRPALVLIPISQTTAGFIKDSIYVLISWLLLSKILLQLRGSNLRNWLNSSSWLVNSYVSFILQFCEGVIVLGEKLRNLFEDYLPKDRIFAVPNGADYSIQPPVNQHVRRNADHIKVLYLGNLQRTKGIEDVIGAMECVKDNFVASGIKLEVVGGWFTDGIREGLLKRVRDRGLPVNFCGQAVGQQKWFFLSEADIFVFPPREPEGHPWVIIEAMAAGLPIISTDQGAITESVLNGVNGFIVPPGCPEQIAEKIILLVSNPELRRRMGMASRRLYEERFTEEAMVRKMKECFERVLGTS